MKQKANLHVRVSDVEGAKIAHSFSANGTMKGVEINYIATFWTIPQGNGLYGQGQGVITTRDGSQEIATETGRGIGYLTDLDKKLKLNR